MNVTMIDIFAPVSLSMSFAELMYMDSDWDGWVSFDEYVKSFLEYRADYEYLLEDVSGNGKSSTNFDVSNTDMLLLDYN